MGFARFQFPTGWNSTLGFGPGVALGAVSIPNGMEFYPASTPAVASTWIGLNSQRYGILQNAGQ